MGTAWITYWEDATRFWKQLMAFVRGQGGDFNRLKSAFLQQQIVETYGRNLQNLRTALTTCAATSSPQHATFFHTVATMLSGRKMEWVEIEALLNAPTSPVVSRPAEVPVK